MRVGDVRGILTFSRRDGAVGMPLTRETVDVSREIEDFLREEFHGKIVRRFRII